MKVLITSAGRRTSLLQAFKRAVEPRGGQVLAGDIDALAPALYLADEAVRLPRIHDEGYIPALLDLVERRGIRLIVPTVDTELAKLAAARGEFAARGCEALISDPELIEVSGDKWLTVARFAARGIRVPRSWLPGAESGELPEKLFLKPRDGSASLHTYAVDRDALEKVLPRVPNAIIQERIEAQEITIDALLDLRGRPLHYVPRTRIRTLAGESIQGVTIDDETVGPWLREVLDAVAAFGGRGPVTLQAFLTEGGPTLSEVNPRFGGGFPLAAAAGGDYPEWLLRMLEGKSVSPRFGDYQRGLYMTRTATEIFTTEPKWA
jgi:carbamoyl-phosphate synthase large subunit